MTVNLGPVRFVDLAIKPDVIRFWRMYARKGVSSERISQGAKKDASRADEAAVSAHDVRLGVRVAAQVAEMKGAQPTLTSAPYHASLKLPDHSADWARLRRPENGDGGGAGQ
jgi:hypothetical protein